MKAKPTHDIGGYMTRENKVESEEEKGKAALQGPEPQADSTKSALDGERTIQVNVDQQGAQKVASRKSRLSRLL